MKVNRRLLIFILALLFQYLNAQRTIDKDSVLTDRVHKLSKQLSVSPSQEHLLLVLEKQQTRARDSVRKANLNQEQRKQWLTNNLKHHDQQLKKILTTAQWKSYQEMIVVRRDAFMKHISEKKMKVEGIKRD